MTIELRRSQEGPMPDQRHCGAAVELAMEVGHTE